MIYLSWAWKQPNLHNFLNQNKNIGKLSSKFKSRNKKNKNNNITCVRQIFNKILLHERYKNIIKMWQKNALKTNVEQTESNVWIYFYSYPSGI